MKNEIIISSSDLETQKIAEKFASELKGNELIALFGNLGSGKTTFVKGLAKGLGLTRRVISPTFVIIRSYLLKDKTLGLKIKNKDLEEKIRYFYHIDLYRIDDQKNIADLGINELMCFENIIAVEWPEKMRSLLPKKRIDIHLEYLENDKRKITFIYKEK